MHTGMQWEVLGSLNEKSAFRPVCVSEAEQQLRLHGKNELEERQTSKLLIFLKLVRRQQRSKHPAPSAEPFWSSIQPPPSSYVTQRQV